MYSGENLPRQEEESLSRNFDAVLGKKIKELVSVFK
jgi:hypothetical protein